MSTLLRKLATLAVAVLSVLAVGTASQAMLLDPRANDPVGTVLQRHNIEAQLLESIAASADGSLIRIVNPSMDTRVQRALDAAVDRGVRVHVVLPDRTGHRPSTANLIKRIGTDTRRASFVTFCRHSCYQPAPSWSLMHAKTAQFSNIHGHGMTIIGSQDLYLGVPGQEWDSALATDNVAVYHAVARWIDGMPRQRAKAFPRAIASEGLTLYLFPRPGDTSKSNFYSQALAPVRCAGGTSVDLMAYDWTESLSSLADVLVNLAHRGCRMRVVLHSKWTAPSVVRKLQAGGVAARYSDGPTAYSHTKLIAIAGTYGSRRVHTVFQGSANTSLGALQRFDENMVRVNDNVRIYNTYETQMAQVWKQGRAVPQVRPRLVGAQTSTVVVGRLSAVGLPVASRWVVLERQVRGAWRTVARKPTDAQGHVTWHLALRGPIRMLFRGTTNLKATATPTMTSRLTGRRDAHHVSGQLSSTVSVRGRAVLLQQWAGGHWRTLHRRDTGVHGRVLWNTTVRGPVRLFMRGAPNLPAAVSPTMR